MANRFAIVFPGQGAQAVGMLSALAASERLVTDTYAEASDVLGFDLWQVTQHGPEQDLNQTATTQPALLAAGVAISRIWHNRSGASAAVCAGHSLGEYAALVHAGSLTFADAVRLVHERGLAMQAAVPVGEGAMAAILGLDDNTVHEVCAQVTAQQVVTAANLNATGQVVIAGHASAVERAIAAAKAAGAKRAVMLAVSVPSHCPLMQPAAEKMHELLAATPIQPPSIPVLHNVTAAQANNVVEIRKLLEAQLVSPVRWVDIVLEIAHQGITRILEFGPGQVLAGLHKRIRTHRGMLETLPVSDPASLAIALAATHQIE